MLVAVVQAGGDVAGVGNWQLNLPLQKKTLVIHQL